MASLDLWFSAPVPLGVRDPLVLGVADLSPGGARLGPAPGSHMLAAEKQTCAVKCGVHVLECGQLRVAAEGVLSAAEQGKGRGLQVTPHTWPGVH